MAPLARSTGSDMNRPVDFTSATKVAPLVLRRDIACEHHADLVGEYFLALVVDDAAAVAVTVESERHISPDAKHLVAHGVQHFHVFGVGVVFGKGVVELAIERDHIATDRCQHLRREGSGGAVAAGADDLQTALSLGRLVRSAM